MAVGNVAATPIRMAMSRTSGSDPGPLGAPCNGLLPKFEFPEIIMKRMRAIFAIEIGVGDHDLVADLK